MNKFNLAITLSYLFCYYIVKLKEAINIKKLTRSKNDKLISGVLGGLGEYFNINPLFLRIIYILLTATSFLTMIILYIAASAIIPLGEDIQEENFDSKNNSNSFLGIILIIIGLVFLANNILPIYFPKVIYMIRYYIRKLIDFWPVLFIVLGVYLLMDRDK